MNQRLQQLNKLSKTTKQVLFGFVGICLIFLFGFICYRQVQNSKLEQKANTEYLTSFINQTYDTENDFLSELTKNTDVTAYASYEVPGTLFNEVMRVNYLKIDNKIIRSIYDKSSNRLSSNQLVSSNDLQTFLKYDSLQEQKLQLIKQNKNTSHIDLQLQQIQKTNPTLN